MNNDKRLYDIISHLASNQPTKATDIFKDILGERIEGSIRDFTKELATQKESASE